MATNEQLDQLISGWLEGTAPVRIPERVFTATFEQTRKTRQHGTWRAFMWRLNVPRYAAALGTAAIVVVAAALAFNLFANQQGRFGVPAPTVRVAFVGHWEATDVDGSNEVMVVAARPNSNYSVIIRDDSARVCGGVSSTMTGVAVSSEPDTYVIAQPEYSCDDDSQPVGLEQDRLANLTFRYNVSLDLVRDTSGLEWSRIGASSDATVAPDPSERPPVAGSMWPQSSLEEVRAAQAHADAGDPNYTGQVDAQLVDGPDGINWQAVYDGQVEIIDRFLRDELGWAGYLHNNFAGAADSSLIGQQFLRCGPGDANPLFPPQPDSGNRGESCPPTIDELTYEAINFDLVQPVRNGADGIWVVQNWSPATFEQADPEVAEEQATERLKDFLDARVAGVGAENRIDVYGDWVGREIPLLYATTSGSPYERYEFERVDGPEWPYGGYIKFAVRLFAEDGTVVEQPIESHWDGGRSVGLKGGLALNAVTTENGALVPMLHAQIDGEVTYLSPNPNSFVIRDDAYIDFSDPAAYWSNCAPNPAPANAAAFAEAVIGDPDFLATDPVDVLVAGVEGIAMDVALAPSGHVCGPFETDGHQWINLLEEGKRMRLFLVDVPEGMSMRTLAITVVAPESQFEEVIGQAQPIIDSIEFHAP